MTAGEEDELNAICGGPSLAEALGRILDASREP